MMSSQVAIVFDLDDTLYPERQFVLRGLSTAARALERHEGVPRQSALFEFLRVLDHDGPTRIFDLALHTLKIRPTPRLLQMLVSAYRHNRGRLDPFPGVRPLLHGLRKAGAMLALLTDGPLDVQRAKVERLGIQELFDVVVFTHELGGQEAWKPSSRGFLEVLRRLPHKARDYVMVGDRPDRDFPVPARFGWRCVRVAFPGGFHSLDQDVTPVAARLESVDSLARYLLASLSRGGDVTEE